MEKESILSAVMGGSSDFSGGKGSEKRWKQI
jgi:hypothetical protein